MHSGRVSRCLFNIRVEKKLSITTTPFFVQIKMIRFRGAVTCPSSHS